jgi:hypothetical protein
VAGAQHDRRSGTCAAIHSPRASSPRARIVEEVEEKSG